jgi:hypothetical protein
LLRGGPLNARLQSIGTCGALVFFGASGCASGGAIHPSQGAPPSTAPATAASRSRLRPLFRESDHPSLYLAAGSLTLGMPIADARRAVPALFEHDAARAPGFDDVAMSAHGDAYGRLGSLTMDLRCESALGDVTELWGAPIAGDDRVFKAKVYWWFDPAARARATLEVPDGAKGCRLVFDRYLPVEELIGNSSVDRFGFESKPLLGMAAADVMREYADYLSGPSADPCKSEILILPPVEYDRTFTRLHMYCGGGKVHSFEIVVRFADRPELRGDIVDRLSRRFGKPAVTQTATDMLVFPAANVRVRLRTDAFMKDATIDVSPGP